MQKNITIILFLLTINFVNAQDSISVPQNFGDTLFVLQKDTIKKDSVKKENFIQKLFNGNLNWNFVATPFANYAPETLWGFGISGAYYIKPKETGGKTGYANFTATYTLKNQFTFKVNSNAYFGKKQQIILYSMLDFNHFPDVFYGIGNKKENILSQQIGYNSDNIAVTLQPQTYIKKTNWLLGANVYFRWEKSKPDSANFAQIPQQQYGVTGFDEYFMLGVGSVISYDSRDNLFYPDKGFFFKSVFTYYPKIGKKSYQMGKIQTDFRHFVPIYKELIFAYQFSAELTFAAAKPFQMLSTIGGMDILRGIRQSVWRNDAMAVLQAELRIPIWRIFKAAVFGGIGDVYSLENWQWATPKIGYGAGLRVKFNKSKANLRLDVARQNLGNNWSFYITVNEAF